MWEDLEFPFLQTLAFHGLWGRGGPFCNQTSGSLSPSPHFPPEPVSALQRGIPRYSPAPPLQRQRKVHFSARHLPDPGGCMVCPWCLLAIPPDWENGSYSLSSMCITFSPPYSSQPGYQLQPLLALLESPECPVPPMFRTEPSTLLFLSTQSLTPTSVPPGLLPLPGPLSQEAGTVQIQPHCSLSAGFSRSFLVSCFLLPSQQSRALFH